VSLKIPIRACAGELLGTALLLIAVVGSGIVAERLSSGNIGVALLLHSLAIGAALVVLIFIFAPVSGAHFNPLVTLAETWEGRFSKSLLPGYLIAQFFGAMLGVFATHAMFAMPLIQASAHVRTGMAQCFSEVIATFGLMLLVLRRFSIPPSQVPWLIGAYITAAIWFTSSFCFVNPTVTLARAFTNTFCGIRREDVPGFAVAQIVGAIAAILCSRFMGKQEKQNVG